MVKHLVFVYGTLKRGFSRNNALQNQRYLGIARTEPKYAMYGYGGYPALIDNKLAELSDIIIQPKSIFGELYEVDDICIRELDEIEGTDAGLFERKEIHLSDVTLSALPTNESVWIGFTKKTAQAYFFKRSLRGAGDCGQVWFHK